MAKLTLKPVLTAIFAVGLGLCTSPAARADTVELVYVVEVAGSTIMKAAYATTINGGSFESVVSGKTSGISNMFTGYRMNLSANGHFADGIFRPEIYENDRKKKGKKAKSTGLTWLADGAVTVGSANGVESPPPAVAAVIGKSTSDPLTAILKMANNQSEKPCSGKYRVYDGKDVYDLALSFRKSVTLASASNSKAMECKLTWTPVAGVAVDKGETDVEVYSVVLAPMQLASGTVLHLPVRMVGKTKGLSVVISTAAVAVDGQAVSAELSN